MTTMYGQVSYYTTCNGSNGACGNCNNSNLDLAWPNLGTGCVYTSCANNCNKSCGGTVNVTNQCPGGTSNNMRVADCYPRATCNFTSACFTQNPALADLTAAAFMSINGGSLAAGRLPAKVVC